MLMYHFMNYLHLISNLLKIMYSETPLKQTLSILVSTVYRTVVQNLLVPRINNPFKRESILNQTFCLVRRGFGLDGFYCIYC